MAVTGLELVPTRPRSVYRRGGAQPCRAPPRTAFMVEHRALSRQGFRAFGAMSRSMPVATIRPLRRSGEPRHSPASVFLDHFDGNPFRWFAPMISRSFWPPSPGPLRPKAINPRGWGRRPGSRRCGVSCPLLSELIEDHLDPHRLADVIEEAFAGDRGDRAISRPAAGRDSHSPLSRTWFLIVSSLWMDIRVPFFTLSGTAE